MGNVVKLGVRSGLAAVTGGTSEITGMGKKLTSVLDKPKIGGIGNLNDEKKKIAASRASTFTSGGMLGVEYNPQTNSNTTFGN